ncbi:MAG: EI24 domain-containing protein, partial [Geminicoccaceae bacterium]
PCRPRTRSCARPDRRGTGRMLQDFGRAFGRLGDARVRGLLWLGILLSLATLAALFVGVEAAIAWVSHTGYPWLDRTLQVLGGLGTAVVAWFLFPSIVVGVSGVFLDRVVDATEQRHHPLLPPPRPVPLAQSIPGALKLLGISVLLNLLVLPAYFVPGLNLPVWLALNGYLVGREYAEMVATRRLAPAAADRVRRERRLTFWAAGVVVAALLAVPVLNLVAPIVGAAFMTLRFQRYGRDITPYLRE